MLFPSLCRNVRSDFLNYNYLDSYADEERRYLPTCDNGIVVYDLLEHDIGTCSSFHDKIRSTVKLLNNV